MQNHPNTPSLQHEGYIRRHSHDVRNYLAAMDLQTVLLQSTTTDLGKTKHLGQIRSLLSCLEEMQLRLGLRFKTPTSATTPLDLLFEECKARKRVSSADKDVEWTHDGDLSEAHADCKSVSVMIVEIVDHFFSYRGGTISVFAKGQNAHFQMRLSGDHKAEDFISGLDADVTDELASLVAQHGGTLVCESDAHELLVTFPRVPDGGAGSAE